MLIHCVFVNFRAEVEAKTRSEILGGFGTLVGVVDGMIDYAFGPNLDFENKSPDFADGFIVTFRDRAAHLAYESHPQHVELGGKLVGLCEGGHDGILVFDIQTSD